MKNVFIVFIVSIFSLPLLGKEKDYLAYAKNYFAGIKEFSSSFIQIQNNEISEGTLFVKNKRIRIEYNSPSNIIFVLKKNKAMYYNKDLEEVQYFNPKETAGNFLLNIFYEEDFLNNSSIFVGEGYFYITKEILIEEIINNAILYFEKNPIQLRKIEINNELEVISFSIINLNFNPHLSNDIFSLANPTLN